MRKLDNYIYIYIYMCGSKMFIEDTGIEIVDAHDVGDKLYIGCVRLGSVKVTNKGASVDIDLAGKTPGFLFNPNHAYWPRKKKKTSPTKLAMNLTFQGSLNK